MTPPTEVMALKPTPEYVLTSESARVTGPSELQVLACRAAVGQGDRAARRRLAGPPPCAGPLGAPGPAGHARELTHLRELLLSRRLLGEERGLDAVEEPFEEPADELGLGDPQLGVGGRRRLRRLIRSSSSTSSGARPSSSSRIERRCTSARRARPARPAVSCGPPRAAA